MTRTVLLIGMMTALGACVSAPNDKTVDSGPIGVASLSELQAGIWVDPNGCEHWIIDDGTEGYLSQRLQRDGKPVCGSTAPPTYATGPFRGGQDVNDGL